MATSSIPPFDFLVSEYYDGLYRFAYSLAKSEHRAADLTQETFLIWAEKGSSLRDPSKAKSWLFTTLYREFLRHKRKDSHLSSLDEDWIQELPDPADTDQARKIEGKEALKALLELDPVYSEPLSLFFLQNLSYREISEILDIPIGTVMSRLSRGKAQLKNVLSENYLK